MLVEQRVENGHKPPMSLNETTSANRGDTWEPILWRQQPFPDNYVPPSFLSALKRNSNFEPYTYSELVLATLSITQHVCVLFIFLSLFVLLLKEELDPRLVLWSCVLGFMLGYILWETIVYQDNVDVQRRKEQRVKTTKSSILLFLALTSLTPVLKTLTEATSSDSIWALSSLLFSLNSILADYTVVLPSSPSSPVRHQSMEPLGRLASGGGGEVIYSRKDGHRLTSVLSMNAAIGASVVLASRLASNLAVFALILSAVLAFALYPLLRRLLNGYSPIIQILSTVPLVLASVISFKTAVSPTASLVLLLGLGAISFGCPAVLVWAQRYKNEIRGPWDPGVPQVRFKD